MGGDEGAHHDAADEAFMAEQDVRDPDAMTALFASGFPRAGPRRGLTPRETIVPA
jgi:hypothetical protein